MAKCISEASVLATRPLTGVGIRVHQADQSGFLTLSLLRATPSGSGPPAAPAAPNGWLRINVGTLDHDIWCPLTAGVVLQDFPVVSGQEVWVATDQINQYSVTGFVASRPHL